jgi:hypothetical protein
MVKVHKSIKSLRSLRTITRNVFIESGVVGCTALP